SLPLPGLPDTPSQALPPLLRQLAELRAEADRRAPGSLVICAIGDFYEAFGEADAPRLASLLDIQLTTKDVGRGFVVPWAGFPIRAAGSFLPRLLQGGAHVVIVEQLEPSAEAKNRLVRRGITRVLTPGTLPEEFLTDRDQQSNYLVALATVDGVVGLASADVTTGHVTLTQASSPSSPEIATELVRLAPSECVLASGDGTPAALTAGLHVTDCDQTLSHPTLRERAIKRQYGSLPDADHIRAHPAAFAALGLLVGYLHQTQAASLPTLLPPHFYAIDGHMQIDRATRRNLGLIESDGVGVSLVSTINRTCTAMGARALREAVGAPLLDAPAIDARLEAVDTLLRRVVLRASLRGSLRGMGDLGRLAVRAGQRTLSPRDCLSLATTLERITRLRSSLSSDDWPAVLAAAIANLDDVPDLVRRVGATIEPNAGASLAQGTIRTGVSPALDEQRALAGDARQWIAAIEARERENTGVRQLKIGFSRQMGYYLGVPVAALARQTDIEQRGQTGAPTLGAHFEAQGWVRKQTMAGEERFITPELRELDARVARAGDEALRLERETFDGLLEGIAEIAHALATTATAVATIDLLLSFAQIAEEKQWVRPIVDDEDRLEISEGRHPVAEDLLPPGAFVPNDTRLDTEQRIILLTGPNMAGKSTYLRQIGIIVLLAQCGSFVPAREAKVGRVDRILTRLGSQDDLATARSTFLIEMEEAATILAAATKRSLVLIDELGRSTGTRDGVAVATAVLSALLHRASGAPRGVVATHYHELGALTEREPRLRPYRMDVLEREHDVVFLHTVAEGAADRSYGVHVARLAGLPRAVTDHAAQILAELEAAASVAPVPRRALEDTVCAAATSEPAALISIGTDLAQLDVLSLSPLAAQKALWDMHERARTALDLPARQPA
ncbi:MAG TPA: DNA mismatch repair protein MutS, partial [Chloroflexota bacterium]|nr:DNA mismatch repair protein MutS [Chloroflexota bacterium]